MCCRFLEACSRLGGPDVVNDVEGVLLVEGEGLLVDGVDVVEDCVEDGFIPDTVLSCSCISIT